ncbi:AAA family ATPase [Pseudomonas tohonis]|uniref:AAA family ATPase n=1 Tax=Pseudomonas tohonis TaxID=2725477 RepID=UPI0021DACF87|nr:hypothetical protein [Pseudomonas tohonis]UXY55222.1 hypothetical protein N9L84_11835 [Pseudomonas tohonis]
MYIRAFRININCGEKNFGFRTSFSRGLNIIRGSNSSGKSTIISSLLYSLGMEELIGGKNELALQYAVREYIEYEGTKWFITESWVTIEIENHKGKIITIKRSITSNSFNSKLARIIDGPNLTKNFIGPESFKFIHDNYSAINEDGFFTYLANFLELKLPDVYDASGKKVKLYLQAIFAALAIEQKRGWTDYIANIPFYSVRDARIKVVEFLLGLDVFEQQTLRAELDFESEALHNEWNSLVKKTTIQARELGLKLENLPLKITSDFDSTSVSTNKTVDGKTHTIAAIVRSLRNKHTQLEQQNNELSNGADRKIITEIESKTEEINRTALNYENALSNLAIHKATLINHSALARQAEEELIKNQTAIKLKKYGAELGLETAKDSCPTCHQHIEDSLSSLNQAGTKMDIETNIKYLESQSKMLSKQEAGLKLKIQDSESAVNELGTRLERARSVLTALRTDVARGTTISRAALKQQIYIDIEIEKIGRFSEELDSLLHEFSSLSEKFKNNQSRRSNLSVDYYSLDDLRKISLFEKMFRANVGEFDYQSAPVGDIEFRIENLLPYLSKIELREIVDSPIEQRRKAQSLRSGDMAQNSSASDFVRLIWSYIMAIYQTSSHPTVTGNHPGLIIMDEPGQHSMATKSQQALFKMLSFSPGLQSIVAASFDDLDAVFKESTDGVEFRYIPLDDKCIAPIDQT